MMHMEGMKCSYYCRLGKLSMQALPQKIDIIKIVIEQIANAIYKLEE